MNGVIQKPLSIRERVKRYKEYRKELKSLGYPTGDKEKDKQLKAAALYVIAIKNPITITV